jgi:hypothetical protein
MDRYFGPDREPEPLDPPAPDTALVALKDQYFQLWKEAEAKRASAALELSEISGANRVLRAKLERVRRAVLDLDEADYD